MSEHQLHEFVAIDGRLSDHDRRKLREVSSRAEITDSRLFNEYHYGDFRGNVRELVAEYFDAYQYAANWGEREVILRFPKALVPASKLEPFDWSSDDGFKDPIEVWETDRHTLISFYLHHERVRLDTYWNQLLHTSDLKALRASILHGDVSFPTLMWISFALRREAAGWRTERVRVPPGIHRLDETLVRSAVHLAIDTDLITALGKFDPAPDWSYERAFEEGVRKFIRGTTHEELVSLVEPFVFQPDDGMRRLLEAYGRTNSGTDQASPSNDITLGEIADEIESVASERLEREMEAARREEERIERERAAAERKRLRRIARNPDRAWDKALACIDEGKRSAYAEAARLLVDLGTIAEDGQPLATWTQRVLDIRSEHSRRRALMQEMNKVGLPR